MSPNEHRAFNQEGIIMTSAKWKNKIAEWHWLPSNPKRKPTWGTCANLWIIQTRQKTRRRMAWERRRACYSLVSSIKDIVGESFIEDDADDQQKGDRHAMSDLSRQR